MKPGMFATWADLLRSPIFWWALAVGVLIGVVVYRNC
jgi:hypothetical protein